MRPKTIADIAKAAGVATSTVSRVIADSPRISRETKDKVNNLIKEMDYHPNIIARSLVSKSSNIIAILIPELTTKAFRHPFYPEIIRGITATANKLNYDILLSGSIDSKDEKKNIQRMINSGIIDGAILMASKTNDSLVNELSNTRFPFVVIGRPDNDNNVNWVDNDNVSVSYQLTKHFIEQGHRDIGFIGINPEFVVTMDRLEGYKKALKDSGIAFNQSLIIEGRYLDEDGYHLAEHLAQTGSKYSAIIVCDDLLAFGVIKYLKEKNITVPNDIAVAGFNNVPLAEYFTPSLTSVKLNEFDLGAKAFEILYSSLSSKVKSFSRAIIPAEVVIRNSSVSR